jgi:predicted nuclease of predicted toxin-antitoxin system
MKLLIDECLHTSLVGVAHRAGFEACHVNFLGLAGAPDRRLMERVLQEGYTFVTNDRVDFLKLFGRKELHAGLIILLPNLAPARQRELFEAALLHAGRRELVNAVLEVDLVAGLIRCREYNLPAR